MNILVNGQLIQLDIKSDVAVTRRVAAHMERRIKEDDWSPYKTKESALAVWKRLGGIRLKVMKAYNLI